MPKGINEERIQTHDPNDFSRIEEDARTIVFTQKVKAHIHHSPAYNHADIKTVPVTELRVVCGMACIGRCNMQRARIIAYTTLYHAAQGGPEARSYPATLGVKEILQHVLPGSRVCRH